jgi:hypothetical protein
MPKKKPLTPENARHITSELQKARTGLIDASFMLAGYLKKDEPLRRRIETMHKDFSQLVDDIREVLAKRS